jgi:hypothetical protein
MGEQTDCDGSQRGPIMKASEVSSDGRISEIDFIECLDQWRVSLMQEKTKKGSR